MDLQKLPTSDLVRLLEHPNSWMRRTARRMLVEKTEEKGINMALDIIKDRKTSPLAQVESAFYLASARYKDSNIDPILSGREMSRSKLPAVRSAYTQLWGSLRNWHCDDATIHPGDSSADVVLSEGDALSDSAAEDEDVQVRLDAVTALRNAAGYRLTTDQKSPMKIELSTGRWVESRVDATLELKKVIQANGKADQQLGFAIWMFLEPLVAEQPARYLTVLAETAPESQPLSQVLVYKSMRRLCDTREAKNLDLAVAFCEKIQDHDVLLAHALDGLVKGQESGVLKPTVDVSKPLAAWRESKNAQVREHALDLAVMWGDEAAIDRLLSIVANPKAPEELSRVLKSLRNVRTDKVRLGVAKFLASPPPSIAGSVVVEAIRTVEDMGGNQFPAALLTLAESKDFAIQQAALGALAGRADWAHAMLDAITAGKVTAVGFPVSVRRSLATSKDKAIRDHAFRVLGAWKEASDDVKALIAAKKKACLEGEPDLAVGKMLFTTTCATCHTLYGPGQKVGPELLGSGRSNLDAILANVIDPNQIIGNGYEAINVTTKDNRTLSGRMVEDTPSHVKLLAIGGAEQIVPRDQIAKLENTHQSTMPMGFGALPDDVFRNLIWYVLAPPEEGPLTKEKKAALSASIDAAPTKKATAGSNSRAIDWESISLWNPAWKVSAPDFERTPVKLADFHGRGNVLLMHPFTKDKPCSLERTVKLEAGKPHKLSVTVAAHDQGDWELRVKINGQEVKKSTVGHDGERWKTVTVDLSEYAGKEVALRVEGAANGWSNEFGYWGQVKVE
jgi:putative heme-binding domain-containing protein